MRRKRVIIPAKEIEGVPEDLPQDLVVYHSYVLAINFGFSVPITDDEECRQVRKYFTNVGIFYPWHGNQILNYCRNRKKREIKKKAKELFPQMFKRGSGPNPIKYPEQLHRWGTFDTIIIKEIVSEVKQSKGSDTLDTLKDIVATVKSKPKYKPKERRKMGNVVEGKAVMSQTDKGITLENYKEVTGKRFRLTKNEKALVESGQATRKQIFEMRKEQGTL